MRKSIAAATAAALTCALTTMTPGAPGAVSTPTSGWFWGDPLPQGNQIDDLAFVGNRGYAIGHFGTALRTDDGGATWSGLRTGLNGFLALDVPSADTIFVAGGCSVRRSVDAGATFRRVRYSSSDTSCRSNVGALAFLSADLGYIAGADGTVQATADGGQSFAARTAIPGSKAVGGQGTPLRLRFRTPTNGFVATSTGQIFQTADAAVSWTQRANVGGALRDLTFVDATTGYAVGDGSRVLRTTDGGATWTPAPATGITPGQTLVRISCASASSCVAVAAGMSKVVRTSDGWATAQEATPTNQGLYAVSFAAGTRVVAAGTGGTVRVSDDAGATFAAVGGSLGLVATRLRGGAAAAFAPSGQGKIGVTLDGGRSWGVITANTPDAVVDVAFPSPALGYALDSRGLVLKTANGGGSWTQLDAGRGAKRAIVAPTSTSVLVVGAGIQRSVDGETFAPVPGLASRVFLTDADQAGPGLFAWGVGTLLGSTNGGRTWSRLRKPGPRLSIRDVDFVTSNVGFLLDTAGRLYRTTNRGRAWTELISLGHADGVAISFHDRLSGYVLSSGRVPGTTLGVFADRTTDGGRSFAPQLVDAGATFPQAVLATGAGTALLADGVDDPDDTGRPSGALLGTTTGGQAGRATTLTLSASPRRRARTGNVVVRGRLRPAEGGEVVTVSRFDLRRGRWETRRTTVASNGSFSTTWRISRSAAFVAGWLGDEDRAGDGSAALVVRVGPR